MLIYNKNNAGQPCRTSARVDQTGALSLPLRAQTGPDLLQIKHLRNKDTLYYNMVGVWTGGLVGVQHTRLLRVRLGQGRRLG